MHILIIGGNRFVGYLTAWRLLAAGHRLTLLNRGTIPDPFDSFAASRVQRIVADRTTPAFEAGLAGKTFDAAIDFAAYTGVDVQKTIAALTGKIAHYIFISTGQVYLVREGCPWPARETDYAGPLIPKPTDPLYHKDWHYGIDKRAGEDALAHAFTTTAFPFTSIRIPMVNGERDYYRRIESYLWRLLDGGPVLLPDGGTVPCRHVYGSDVARAIEAIIKNAGTFGKAFNLCQQQQPSLRELVEMLANLLGVQANIQPISTQSLATANLRPIQISPFSDPWMSRLDPSMAQQTLGFRHQPLANYLEKIVTSFVAHPPGDQPANYAHRKIELELARRHGG